MSHLAHGACARPPARSSPCSSRSGSTWHPIRSARLSPQPVFALDATLALTSVHEGTLERVAKPDAPERRSSSVCRRGAQTFWATGLVDAFSRLSAGLWSGREDLNLRPPVPQTSPRYDRGRVYQPSGHRPRSDTRPAHDSGGRNGGACVPGLEVGELVLRFAGQEVDQAALDALALEERVVDLPGDRHLDAEARRRGRSRHRRCRRPRRRPAGTPRSPATAGPWPAPRRVDGCGTAVEPQVATTSPMPARPGKRQRIRAGGDPQSHHLGQAAGHEPGLAVVAEAEPIGGARGDRDDVLQRSAELHAEDVGVACRAGTRGGRAAPTTRSASAGSAAATTADAGRPRAISGPGSGRTGRRCAPAAMPPASAITSVIRRSVPRSRPLTTDRTSAAGRDAGGDRRHRLPQMGTTAPPRSPGRRPRGPPDPPSAGCDRAGRCPAAGARCVARTVSRSAVSAEWHRA